MNIFPPVCLVQKPFSNLVYSNNILFVVCTMFIVLYVLCINITCIMFWSKYIDIHWMLLFHAFEFSFVVKFWCFICYLVFNFRNCVSNDHRKAGSKMKFFNAQNNMIEKFEQSLALTYFYAIYIAYTIHRELY